MSQQSHSRFDIQGSKTIKLIWQFVKRCHKRETKIQMTDNQTVRYYHTLPKMLHTIQKKNNKTNHKMKIIPLVAHIVKFLPKKRTCHEKYTQTSKLMVGRFFRL